MSEILKSFEKPYRYRDSKYAGTDEEYIAALRSSSCVYVGNLSFHTTEEQLYEVFRGVGEIRRIIMGLDSVKKTPCGFCFVEFYEVDDAVRACVLLDGMKVDERVVKVDKDTGFVEGRQYGRGQSGGQLTDERRNNFDSGRGGYGSYFKQGGGGKGGDEYDDDVDPDYPGASYGTKQNNSNDDDDDDNRNRKRERDDDDNNNNNHHNDDNYDDEPQKMARVDNDNN